MSEELVPASENPFTVEQVMDEAAETASRGRLVAAPVTTDAIFMHYITSLLAPALGTFQEEAALEAAEEALRRRRFGLKLERQGRELEARGGRSIA